MRSEFRRHARPNRVDSASMKTAIISAARAHTESGLSWTWHCDADKTSGERGFTFYYDCVTDARAHGCEVDIARGHGAMAPGGTGFELPPHER